MQKAIIGKKVGMTQIFDETGKVIPVTVIEAGPCTVVQNKTVDKEGFASIPLGFSDVQEKKLTKAEACPVSYTHLDVYKRQVYGHSSVGGYRYAGDGLCGQQAFCHGPRQDVYKRQGFCFQYSCQKGKCSPSFA